MRRLTLCAAALTAAASFTAIGLAAQSAAPAGSLPDVPFGPGERAEYDLTLGVLGRVGDGAMEVVGIEDIHGHPTYHLRLQLNGRVAFARVDDTLEAWMDVQGLFARRIHKRQHEVNYRAERWYDLFPDSMFYRRIETGDTAALASSEPLDEVSFLYFVRTLDLEVGETYRFNRYYKDSGNPVIIHVLRRETMEASDGSAIPVIVVRPIIETSGLFGEGGRAEVYFTDDDRRIMVRLTSRVPIIGRLGLTLTGYTPGERLTALPVADGETR